MIAKRIAIITCAALLALSVAAPIAGARSGNHMARHHHPQTHLVVK